MQCPPLTCSVYDPANTTVVPYIDHAGTEEFLVQAMLSSPPYSLRLSSAITASPHFQIVEGRDPILLLSGTLIRLAAACDQPGAMQDLAYFLSKPGLLRRVPHLMLFFRGPQVPLEHLTEEHLLGALLLYDNRMIGCSTRVFTTNDRSGRNTLLAPAAQRSALAEFAARVLIDRGAHVVMISYRDEASPGESDTWTPPVSSRLKQISSRWARREREIPDYLRLESTFEATLALIGKRTRNHLRYYRRRAEKELGCTFFPSVEMGRAEFLAYNRACMYAVPDKVAAWRYDVHKELSCPLLMGIAHQDGRWLSIVGGRRFNSNSEILWQMNLDGLPLFSLSLVMRSFFMEHEIAQGSLRFYLEGGSSHPIRNSFVTEKLIDLAVLRRSPAALVTRKLAKHVVPSDNELAQIFSDSELTWRSAPVRIS